ncbi:hypothetical protein C0J52_21562 [Blattella germanica]|nr:hypothetical protein C0J52_21562 [Blattella germanica]
MFDLHVLVSFFILLFIATETKGLNEAMLGESCNMDKECLTRQMECTSGTCSCMNRHYASEDRRNCIATVGSPCYETNDCYGLTSSECHLEEKLCVCTLGYRESTDSQECLPDSTFQGACTETIQCNTNLGAYSICQGEICLCQSGFHYSVSDRTCVMNKYLHDGCVNASQCITRDFKTTTMQTSQASCVDGTCRCRDGLVENDGNCRAGANLLEFSLVTVFMYWIVKYLI